MSTEWSQWEPIKGQRLKGHLFDQIQTLCVVHPVDGFPVYPLPVRRHKRTSWATSQHYKYTKVVLSSGFMWWNELCWPPSAITFQHKNTTVWERGDLFTHLAECLHSHSSKNRPRNPPSVHLQSLHHSALKQITGRSMSCVSWSCRASTVFVSRHTLPYAFRALRIWRELHGIILCL